MYCTTNDVIKFLPKQIREALLNEPNYEDLINEKIEIAQDYITFVVLMKDDYFQDSEITPDLKMFTAELSALYVIEHFIHMAPESMGFDIAQPNYKAVIVNKINELKEHIIRKFLDNNMDGLPDIEKSFYGLFVPKEREENV